MRDGENPEVALNVVGESRHISWADERAHREGNVLGAVGEKEPRRNLAARRLQIVRVDHELIFVKFARLRKCGKSLARKRLARIDNLRRRNQELAVYQFELQQRQRRSTDIRSVRGHGSAALRSRLPGE